MEEHQPSRVLVYTDVLFNDISDISVGQLTHNIDQFLQGRCTKITCSIWAFMKFWISSDWVGDVVIEHLKQSRTHTKALVEFGNAEKGSHGFVHNPVDTN